MTLLQALLCCAVGLLLTASPASAKQKQAAAKNASAERVSGGFCSATTQAQYEACGYESLDDYWVARALCINVPDAEARDECFDDAEDTRRAKRTECSAQRAQRLQICGELGEARFARSFDPADFESDYHNLQHPNPYFPLTIGYRWDYAGSLEVNTITALDETKLIEGVTCIVLNDKRYEDGRLAEDTDDWYGQRKDGTVEFCGEAVSNFETFPGDNPLAPERVSTDGQWKTGRDGIPSGAYILGSPRVGDTHRSEFAPGVAEDTVRYLSTSYGFGADPTLDRIVPRALVDRFCSRRDCWVTGENTGLEPGAFTYKFYARDVGFFLGVDKATGDTVQLIDCSFDSRCVNLPQP